MLDTNGDAANSIDELFETLKVNFEIMMNRYTERTVDCAHHHRRTFAIRDIDSLGVFTVSDRHPQVAWHRHERDDSC